MRGSDKHTNASQYQLPSGWGYIIKDEGREIRACGSLGDHSSVFQVEIVAITEAMKQISLVKGKQISFLVDSYAGLPALKVMEIRSKIVQE